MERTLYISSKVEENYDYDKLLGLMQKSEKRKLKVFILSTRSKGRNFLIPSQSTSEYWWYDETFRGIEWYLPSPQIIVNGVAFKKRCSQSSRVQYCNKIVVTNATLPCPIPRHPVISSNNHYALTYLSKFRSKNIFFVKTINFNYQSLYI